MKQIGNLYGTEAMQFLVSKPHLSWIVPAGTVLQVDWDFSIIYR